MGYALVVREVVRRTYGDGPERKEPTGGSRRVSAEAREEASAEARGEASAEARGDAPLGAWGSVLAEAREVSAEATDRKTIEALAEEIMALAARHFSQNTYELLVRIACFDRLRGWVATGHRTCAHWLALHAKIDLVTAREHVRVARALEKLPLTSRWMAEGKLSFSQVRALTRVADPENEVDLLEIAEESTAAELERVVRAWKRESRMEEVEWEEERHASRTLAVFPDEDGMYVVHGRLEPEVGVLLMRAIEAAGDALYGPHEKPDLPPPPEERAREAARRRADALGLIAERALAAGFGGGKRQETGAAAAESGAGSEGEKGASQGVACACGGKGRAPISGTQAERYLVVLHVDADTLSKDREPGRSELEDGTRVSAETARRIACDASLITVTHAADGSVLNVGRKRRTVPPAIRRAAESRDRGCRFPGCGLRFTTPHHVEHWADGGETSLRNTILLCRFHHRLVHEGGWTVEWVGEEKGTAKGTGNGQGREVQGREVRFRDPQGVEEAPARGNATGPGRGRVLRGAPTDSEATG